MVTTTPPTAAISHDPETPILHVRGVIKRYGGTLALDHAELKIGPGEIHGLLGENGSGKSTLIKVLAGVVAPNAGQLSLFGETVDFPLRSGEAHRRGLRFVHQNLGLIPSMTVGENLLIERFALARNSAFISWRHFYDDATRLLAQYGLDLDPRQPLVDLAPINRSLVAIVRAVAADHEVGGVTEPRLLVLDEPTVFLPRGEVTRVFAMLRSLMPTGVGVLFVSHRMDEVREHTDRVTVLRDGSNAGTEITAHVDDDALVRMIVGRDIAARTADHPDPPAQPGVALELTGFRSRTLRDVSLSVAPGEILGLTGLAGSGYEEVIYSLFGAHPSATGAMVLDGTPMTLRTLTPRTAIDAGIALIPADRMREGLAGTATLEENVTLNVVNSYFRRMLLRQARAAPDRRPAGARLQDPARQYEPADGELLRRQSATRAAGEMAGQETPDPAPARTHPRCRRRRPGRHLRVPGGTGQRRYLDHLRECGVRAAGRSVHSCRHHLRRAAPGRAQRLIAHKGKHPLGVPARIIQRQVCGERSGPR